VRALDTNILVRMVLADDAAQTQAVKTLFLECRRNSEAMFVSHVVLCELVWVLWAVYHEPKSAVAKTLDEMLLSPDFFFEDLRQVQSAQLQWADGHADFADYLIGAIAAGQNCRDVVTFDRGLAETTGFTVLR